MPKLENGIYTNPKPFRTGDRVRRLFSDLAFSAVGGVIMRDSGMGGMVTVQWDGRDYEYQEDPLHLIPEEGIQAHVVQKRRAQTMVHTGS